MIEVNNSDPFSGYTKEEFEQLEKKYMDYTLKVDEFALKNEQNIQWYTPLKCIFISENRKSFVYLPAKFLQQEGLLSPSIDLSEGDKYIIPWEKFNVDGKTIEDFFSSSENMTKPKKYAKMFQYVKCLYNKPGEKIPTDDYGNEKSSQVDNFRKEFNDILKKLQVFNTKNDTYKVKNEYFHGILLILIIKRVLYLVNKDYQIDYGGKYLSTICRISRLDAQKDNCSMSQLDGTRSSLNSHYAEKEYAMFFINLSDRINLRMILECVVTFENYKQLATDEYLPKNYFSKKEIEKRQFIYYFNKSIPLRKPFPCIKCSNGLCFKTQFILHEYVQLTNYKLNKMQEKFFSHIIDFRIVLSVYDMYIFKIYVDSKLKYNECWTIINNKYPETNESITYLKKVQHSIPMNRDILEKLLFVKHITKDIKITDFDDFCTLLSKKDHRLKNKQAILDILFYKLDKNHKVTVIKNNLIVAKLIFFYFMAPIEQNIANMKINFYFAFISVYVAIRLQDIRVDFLKYPIKDYIQKNPQLKNLISKEYKKYVSINDISTKIIGILPTNTFDIVLGVLVAKYSYLFELNKENINNYIAYTLEDYNYFYKNLCEYQYEKNEKYGFGVLYKLNKLVITN